MKRNVKFVAGILTAALMLCSLSGCGSDGEEMAVDAMEAPEETQVSEADKVQEESPEKTDAESPEDGQAPEENQENTEAGTPESDQAQGEDLDTVTPDPADDTWYMKGNVYTDDKGRMLEVFFSDEGMLEFAFDGLSVYFAPVSSCQLENDWRIYTCDGGEMVVYYPGDPAHIEISDDGDYAGIYEAGGDTA